jgi:hypothetical protein
MALPYCCVLAELDGFTAEEHAQVCREPQPRPDLAPTETEGGPR